jgi:hypothetical protein
VATETRVFESVDNSPEAKAANAAYFAEQGLAPEVVDSADAVAAAAPPVEAVAPPVAGAPAPAGEADAADAIAADTETVADWDSAQTDGKRLNRYARKRQEAKVLKAANEKLERDLAELKAAKPAPPAETKPGDAPPVAGTEAKPPAVAAPAAVATEAFTEPEPVKPKYEDFANQDDQLLAYQDALFEHTRKVSAWDRRREKFEDNVVAQKTQKANETRTAQNERITRLTAALSEIRVTHPDFDTVTNKGNVFTPALSGASTAIPGGLDAAYRLAKDPVKLKQFNEMTSETQVVDGKTLPTQRAWDVGVYLLQQMVGSPAAAAPGPAGSPPAASPSSSSPPREEPAAPRAARGRTSDEPGRDNLSGDARRDLQAKQLSA